MIARTGRRLGLLGLVVGSATACTASGPETKVEPEPAHTLAPVEIEPAPRGVERELGPLLGGKVIERTPTPGRWSASVRFSQHRFVTMEHTVAMGASGSVVLRLGEDGSARACVVSNESSTSDISHYQTRDGQDHHYANDDSVLVGMTGAWKRIEAGSEIEIVFDRMKFSPTSDPRDEQGCEVDPASEAYAQPALRCFGFAANAKVPSDALLCQVPETMHWLTTLALLIGDSPRAGSWALRRDQSGHGVEPPADAVAWLLLGAEPGLGLSAQDNDRDAEPLSITVETVADPRPR